jgi:UDP-GlcNAc3NAcA epimerase
LLQAINENHFKALVTINKTLPIILPLHPRTKKIIKESSFSDLLSSLRVVNPVSYIETQRLEMGAKLIFTDSGGMQKEAYFHKVPCITLRDETEWVETVNSGWNKLAGTKEDEIIKCYENVVMPSAAQKLYGDGTSSSLIVNVLLK